MIIFVGGTAAAAGTLDSYQHQSKQCFLEPAETHPRSSTGSSGSGKETKNTQSSFQVKQVYDIEKVLGEGTYGMVYRARRKLDGVKVALKTMPREFTGKTAFEREVAVLQLLSRPPSHEHVVKLYDLHRDEKNYYLAMELVEGGELFEHLVENGPYSEALAAKFVRQFAEALCFVHSSGYTHADLKPENLMLAPDNRISSSSENSLALKVVDFGCACTHDLGRKDMLLPAQEFAMGCSFLHQSALGNQFELQRILQDRPNLVNFRDYDKRTALHVAASEGHLDICRFLVERGARINRVDRWGGSPLDDAHRHGHTEVFHFLGQQGATFGSTAAAIEKFISAASQGDAEEVQALLEFGNIDLNQGDYDQRTALHLAAGEGRVTIVRLLCEAGADVNVKDRWGNCPLDDAKRAEKNSAAVMRILERYGAMSSNAAAAPTSSIQKTESGSTLQKQVQDEGTKFYTASGTIAYSAPELFAKCATPTPASDMWAAGVIVYILLTGSYVDTNQTCCLLAFACPLLKFSSILYRHPFDKFSDATDEQIAQSLIKVGSTTKAKDGEQELNLMDELVFDERIQGLSESCIDLMKNLMQPDPDKRMTSDDFRRHPWVQGLTASWKTMARGFEQLEVAFWQNRFRDEILKKFATSLGAGNGQTLSEHDMETMFRALDLKQNGVLELDEILSVFRDLNIPQKNIRKIFACADLDGTGAIRWDEFRALMSRHMGEEDGADRKADLQVQYLQNRFRTHIINRFGKRQLREIFNAIDLEGNGVLDPHEIRVVLRSAGEPEDVISRIVASLDVNRDGGVDWSEFQEIMGAREDD